MGLFRDSLTRFAQLEGPEARYGEALTLLMRQPKTASNIQRSSELLAELAASQPDSELGIGARYHLGRIEQTHRITPDPAAARRQFQQLIKDHPAHPYAQQAVVKLAILELYERVSPEVRLERFLALTARAPSLADPAACRDLYLLLADTAQRYDYAPALALDLLLRADESGIVRRIEQANTWVRITVLASENDQPAIARAYGERFLQNFLRDNRRLTIEQLLARLPETPTTGQTADQEASR